MRLEISPRLELTRWHSLSITLGSLTAALLLGAGLLAILDINPWDCYRAMFSASLFGGAFALSDTLVKATPLLLCGLGLAMAFKAQIWNIGAEGQFLLGAWAATGVATFALPPSLPRWIMLLAMALAAMLAGGIWAALAGALKVRLGVNEILSSLMLVYVAQHLIAYFIFGPWSEGGFPLTPQFPTTARLPRLSDLAERYPSLGGLTVHLGIVLGIVICVGLWLFLQRSAWGFELRLLGDNPANARYLGLAVARRTLTVMIASGALAGLGGMFEVSGVVYRLQDRFSPGYGFFAIAVAWLGRLHPLGVLVASLLFGALLVGSKEVQPQGVAMMLEGLLIMVVIACDFFLRYQLHFKRQPRRRETT